MILIRRYILRYRKTKNYKEKLAELEGKTYIHIDEKSRPNWKYTYPESKPLMIEIGCGKAGFLLELVKRNPEINYVGVEKNEALMLEAATIAEEQNLNNIKFISFDANEIENYFEKESVSRIYLNFSDPWPKIRHSRRRLTSRGFLEKYANILRENKEIIFKTDNKNLFEFTLLELSLRKDKLISIDIDLHSKQYEIEDERLVLTEYEKRFMEQELPIYRLEAQLLGNK